MERYASGGGSFRGGRGRGSFGRGRGGRGRGRGRGGGRGGRGSSGFHQHRRHEDTGYTEGYTPAPAPQAPQQFGDYNPGYPPPQQGYAPPPQPFPPQPDQFQPQYQQYQAPRAPDQYQQPPAYPPQGYAEDNRGGYNNGNPPLPSHPPLPVDRYQSMETFQNQAPPTPAYQHYHQPPPLQYQQLPPPQQFQQFQDESSKYVANPPLPPPQPPVNYADAARVRQQAYAPIRSEDNGPKVQPPSPYQQSTQPPPPSYQQQLPPPLPPTLQNQRQDWNYPPPQEQQWPQQPQFGGTAPGYAFQGQNREQPRQQGQFQREPKFQDRRQDRHDHQHQQQHRPPPPSYICHKCNQPGHWKLRCPLFANENDNRFGAQQEEPFQQRYGAKSDGQWDPPVPPAMGNQPQDPRRELYPADAKEGMVNPQFALQSGQPPLPDGPVPPLPSCPQPPLPYDNDGNIQQQPQPGQEVWKCETCAKSFSMVSQYDAHMRIHVKCSDCDFWGSRRVVTAHYLTAHGQYGGQGLKEIDVEGQKFMVLVGDSAEDITKWREERRKKWLAMSRERKQPTGTRTIVTGKRKLSVSSEEDLEDGEIEEDEEAKAKIALKNAVRKLATSDTGAKKPPAKKQRKPKLCMWFSRGHCRFDAAQCKYSHDGSAFACRAMMYKGTCSKGMHCPFSHDTAVLSEQRVQSQKASKERATDQKWRGEQKSLLRKLLAKDVRVEQRKMLQIVHFLVANDYFRSSASEKTEGSAQQPTTKIEVLSSTEANEPIQLVSKDIVMEEACADKTSTGESQSAASGHNEVVTEDGNVEPVVEASACSQEAQEVTESPSLEKKKDE